MSILVDADGGILAARQDAKERSIYHFKTGATTLSDDDMKDIIDRLQMACEDLKRREVESRDISCDFCHGTYVPATPVYPVSPPIGTLDSRFPVMGCTTCLEKITTMVADMDWLRYSMKRYVMVKGVFSGV